MGAKRSLIRNETLIRFSLVLPLSKAATSSSWGKSLQGTDYNFTSRCLGPKAHKTLLLNNLWEILISLSSPAHALPPSEPRRHRCRRCSCPLLRAKPSKGGDAEPRGYRSQKDDSHARRVASGSDTPTRINWRPDAPGPTGQGSLPGGQVCRAFGRYHRHERMPARGWGDNPESWMKPGPQSIAGGGETWELQG